ncbi:AI-2E family transporter [Microbacter margulisiae]|uniref:Putative PurR-regulated permease PerM n=1 Tax=Microbacter margulisiae TaxID=1350067 RepID=A0A7W5DQ59_9PORP|nr:AI-2E family transporter [Microbacter margulisiae]MBB3187045.1 putative PurR-regulated permease PerM [Microbacter margulisiae]
MRKPFTFDRVIRLIIGLAILLVTFILLKRLSSVLLPFFIGWLIAYMINPLVDFFQYRLKLKNRALSVFAAISLLLIVFTGVIILLINPISQEIQHTGTLIQYYLVNPQTQEWRIPFLPNDWQTYLQTHYAYQDLQKLMSSSTFIATLNKMQPHFMHLLSGTFQLLLNLLIVFVIFMYVVFILIDYNKITNGWSSIIPKHYRPFFEELFEDLTQGMNRYFRGQALVAASVGVICAIGFSILGLPLAIIMGLFIGLLNMVPYMQWFGYIPVVLLLGLKSIETGQNFSLLLIGLLIIILVEEAAQNLYLIPKIMGKVTGLKPALILLSLSIWGSLLGIIGMIIALPVTTLMISYYKRYILIADNEPAPLNTDTTNET